MSRIFSSGLLTDRRYFLPFFVTAELLLALAIPFLLIEGYHTILGSTAGQLVDDLEADDPNWRLLLEATPIVAAVEVSDGIIQDVTLLIHNEITENAEHPNQLSPTGTALVVPGNASFEGVPLQQLDAEEAAEAVSKNLRLQLARVEVVESGSVLVSLNESISAGDWIVEELPLVSSSGDSSTMPIDNEEAELLIQQFVAFPAGASPGDRLSLKILSRSQEVNLELVAASLGSKGFEINEIGNVEIFDDGPTTLLVPQAFVETSPLLRQEIERLASMLGIAIVEDSETEDLVVTLIIGSDLRF